MQRTPPELTTNARYLRTNATEAERIIWKLLRESRPRFTRQLVVSHYIVDLACRSLKLAIEFDGSQHLNQAEPDLARTRYLESRGWTVLRFWNAEVSANPQGVAEAILAAVARLATHPRPLP